VPAEVFQAPLPDLDVSRPAATSAFAIAEHIADRMN
jgi:hypothetical protein